MAPKWLTAVWLGEGKKQNKTPMIPHWSFRSSSKMRLFRLPWFDSGTPLVVGGWGLGRVKKIERPAMHLMPLKPNSQRKRGADASLATHLFLREDSSFTCSQINLSFILLLLSTKQEGRNETVACGWYSSFCHVTFDFVELRCHNPPSRQQKLRLSGSSCSTKETSNRKAGSAGAGRGERRCRQVLPRCLAHFLLRQNSVRRRLTTALLVFSLWVSGEGTLRMPDIYVFECNWVFQLGPTCDSGIRSHHPGNWSFWFFVLSS